MTAASAFALPLAIRKNGESFVVEDANGIALAYIHFEDEPTRLGFVNRLLTFRS